VSLLQRLLLAENHIDHPAALRVRLLFAKVLGQLGVARFKQGIVKGEGTVLASVQRLGELDDGLGGSGYSNVSFFRV
jgi:hypothetical protein